MSPLTEPVWVWLPGSPQPVKAAIFEWTPPHGPGRFEYTADYKKRPEAFALDPFNMRMGHGNLVATKQHAIFGALRDAGPDTWGEELIKKQYKLSELTPLQRLTLAGTNGSGCVATGELRPERASKLHSLAALEQSGDRWARGEIADGDPDFQMFLQAFAPTPTLGGAKPKVELEFDDAQWIAKFADKGDPADLACAEAAALSLAAECGIETPEHRVILIGSGERQKKGLLLRRFDRRKVAGGFERLGFASAFTVMDLDTGVDSDPLRSYYRFAHQTWLWAARANDRPHAVAQAREIWRRIVLTGLIGNRDDHPRNHALILDQGRWRVSPVFDIIPVAQTHEERATVMPFVPKKPDGNAISVARLIEAAPHYHWRDADEAKGEIERMARIIYARWEQLMVHHGASRQLIDNRASAFGLAHDVATQTPDAAPQFQP